MLEEGFAEVSMDKRNGWNRAKTKEGKQIFWSPPKLPVWALPPAVEKENPQLASERTPDEILSDFTSQASDCQSVEELKGIYTPAWNALATSSEHQTKCVEVFKTRGAELKKAA